jgi:hypothetical protein
MSLFDQLKVQIENNVPLPSVSNTPKRGRGRPKGSTNKPKVRSQEGIPACEVIEPFDVEKPKDLKCYRTGKRGRPKEKDPEYTVIGSLNNAVAVEWEAPPENPEELEKDKIRRSRNQDWKRFCARGYCGHTATLHSTDGKGRCYIEDCKCGEFL